MNNRPGKNKNNFVIIQNGSGLCGHRHVVKRTLNIQNGNVHKLFLFVRVGTNKLLGRLAEELVNQSFYTIVNGLFAFPKVES